MEVSMLRNILKAASLAAMAIVLVAASAQAQQTAGSASALANADANVLSELSIGYSGGGGVATTVEFGDISQTTAGVVELHPKGLSSSNYVGPNAAVGSFQIKGAGSKTIHLTYPGSVNLSDGASTPHYMTWFLQVVGDDGSGSQTTPTGFTQTTTSTGTQSDNITTGTTGTYNIWIGGELAPGQGASSPTALTGGADLPPGDYTGSASFTVEYN